jgi:hypothetical protein
VVVVSVLVPEVRVGFLLKVFGSTALSGFFSGTGEVMGAATSVFCSQAPKSAALARMQISFFIVWIGFLYCFNTGKCNFSACRNRLVNGDQC